jgi:hypothetical protein
MPKALFVSFDLVRPGDPEKPLGIASILATAKSCADIGDRYAFEHLSIGVFPNASAGSANGPTREWLEMKKIADGLRDGSEPVAVREAA